MCNRYWEIEDTQMGQLGKGCGKGRGRKGKESGRKWKHGKKGWREKG